MSEGLHSGVHLDPDALNAFVEGALPEHERVGCLAHLAECGQCREVVFLARKAAELAEPVGIAKPVAVPQAPVLFWHRFLRPMAVASVVAMALVAVVSFGLYRMVRSAEPQPQVTASTKAPVDTAPPAPAPAAKANAEEQTPELPPPTRKPGPQSVPRKQQQPSVESAPALSADTGGVVQLAAEAGVVGTIIDPAGAVIASARVELKNEDTGTTYTSTSDARGQYSVAGMPPGRYDFSVTSPGFKKLVRPGINVQPREIARLDSTLNVGAAAESVTVTAEATLLKTETGDFSQQAGVTSLNQLPLLSGASGNFRAVTGASPVYALPDKSTPVSVAAKDKLVVAVDSAGALFFSENAGKNWMRVRAVWKGKAVRVAVSANAMFELTTNPSSTWVSADGRNWSEAHTSR
jgi:hypothetical protein